MSKANPHPFIHMNPLSRNPGSAPDMSQTTEHLIGSAVARPYITERLLMGRKESNQTNKRTPYGTQCGEIINQNHDPSWPGLGSNCFIDYQQTTKWKELH